MERCPNCGYCKHCGQATPVYPTYPFFPATPPPWGTKPQSPWWGTQTNTPLPPAFNTFTNSETDSWPNLTQ